MQELLSYQNNLLRHINDEWYRYLIPKLQTNERLLGIKGLRGVGKTTMLLQFLKYHSPARDKAIYVTADHPYFYSKSLFGLAEEWYQHGGSLMLIDEVHKYEQWSRELKLIYDGFPTLQIIFTSSSALDLYRGESDLSRRLITLELFGLSFREFLNYRYGHSFNALELSEILSNHKQLSESIVSKIRPLPLFKEYLETGNFPFINKDNIETTTERTIRMINTVLEVDIIYAYGYSASNVQRIKKLLGVIATAAPFQPNISKIAERLGLGRNTVNEYLQYLADARILRLVNRPGRGMTKLQKPDKIYFENASIAHAISPRPDKGSIRETFFAMQLSAAGNTVSLAPKADFLINDDIVIEVGGKNKDSGQLKDIPNSWLALDDIEIGFGKKIPLWLFGFLY